MSGAKSRLNTRGTFVRDPEYTLFSSESVPREEYLAGTFEIPFDSPTYFGEKASVLIPPKGEIVRRVSVRSKLPVLYNPLGPGYVYPLYTDQVDGSIYVQTSTLAIQPGDFVGYFNTQFLNAWATNFVGTGNISVAYDSTLNKFVFTSPVYAYIFFQNEQSASFWGFDIRTPDLTVSGYPAFNFTSGTLTAPLTLVQGGWIRGFTPPPSTGFSYVDSVACRLIKEATLTIGGQTIDRLTSERLIIEDDLGVPYENQAALTILEGKNDSSAITTQREYYTRLTFNTDTISMNALKNQDVRVNVEFEKFENLPSSYISSNGFLDGASYITSNLQAITGDAGQNFDPDWIIGWKNYVIMGPLLNDSFRFYNEDTGTWYSWTPGSGSDAPITTNGGTIYGSSGGTLKKADIATVLATSTTPWTSGYNPFSGFPAIPFGQGNNRIRNILSDARYVYLWYQVNYFIIGSTYTSLVSGSLDGTSKIWTIVYRFYNKQTSSWGVSDVNALTAFWTAYCGSFTSAVETSNVNSGSDLLVTGTLTYATTQNSGNANIPGLNVHNNMIWVRYDSTASFSSASSYTFTLTSGLLPASVKDVFPGVFDTISIPNNSIIFKPTFDGRYIYFSTDFFTGDWIAKLDTQNFSSTSAYVQKNGLTLSPDPIYFCDGPYISDGRYLYVSSSSVRGAGGMFSRYDSTKAIDQQASWEYYLGDTSIRANNGEVSIPCGFDGKYVYFHTQSQAKSTTSDFYRITLWHKYDTTKPFTSTSSWEWISIKPGTYANDITASDGSSPQITLLGHRSDLPQYIPGTIASASTIGGTGNDAGLNIKIDSNGNKYVTGYYTSTTPVPIQNLDGSSTTYSLPATSGGSDGFIIKYDSSGNVTGYSYLNGTSVDIGISIAIDTSGTVYVTGYYQSTGTVTIRNIDSTASSSAYSLPISSGGSDLFIIKYNSSGNVTGYSYLNGTSGDSGVSIAIDTSGTVYVTGYYESSGPVTIQNIDTTGSTSVYSLPATSGGSDVFIIKYNSSGNVTGYSYLNGTSGDAGNSIAIDSTGTVYVTGYYESSGPVTIQNIDTTASTSAYSLPATSGGSDVFIIKYNSSGNVTGYSYLNGTSGDAGYITIIVEYDRVYVAGYYQSSGPVTIRNIDTTASASARSLPATSGGFDIFLIYFNSNGTVYRYSYLNGLGNDQAISLASTSGGILFMTGLYSSSAPVTIRNIDNSASASTYQLPASSTSACFVIEWNDTKVQGFSYFDGTSSDYGTSIVTDSNGNLYLTGAYESTGSVNLRNIDTTASMSSLSLPATSGGTTDCFIIKYNSNMLNPDWGQVIRFMRFIVGSRYIYITEGDGRGGNMSLQDFIQYNPITMSGSGSFPSSALVKYEMHNNTPPTNQIGLYGQTDLNEFTIRQGSTTETFQLRFVNPVREIWVVVDTPGVVSRLVLRLNNEILVDDDQVTTRYQRAFESHTTMPTSSNVNVYSFSFDPEKLHPSGTLNMSRIAYPSIDVTLASAASSDLGLRVYSKSFNVLGYQGGLGGLLFNSAL